MTKESRHVPDKDYSIWPTIDEQCKYEAILQDTLLELPPYVSIGVGQESRRCLNTLSYAF